MKIRLLIIFLLLLNASASSGQESHWGNRSGFLIEYAFSHSGKVLALSNDTGLAIMDLRTGKILRSFSLPHSYCGYRQMVFAPDDTALFFIGCQWYQQDEPPRSNLLSEGRRGVYSILLFNLRTGSLTTIDSDFHDCHIALKPDGTQFAVLTASGDLSLYNIGSNHPLHTAKMPPRRDWPNEYRVWFSRNDSKIVAYWFGGKLLIYDARKLGSKVYIEDSLEWGIPEVLGNTVFLTRNPRTDTPKLINLQTGYESKVQPSFLDAESRFMDEAPIRRPLHPVSASILGDGRYLLARYEVRTTGVPYEGGSTSGTDTLIITPLDHPEHRWGMAINRRWSINDDGPPSRWPTLVFSDGREIKLLNLASHTFTPIFPP